MSWISMYPPGLIALCGDCQSVKRPFPTLLVHACGSCSLESLLVEFRIVGDTPNQQPGKHQIKGILSKSPILLEIVHLKLYIWWHPGPVGQPPSCEITRILTLLPFWLHGRQISADDLCRGILVGCINRPQPRACTDIQNFLGRGQRGQV